MKRESCAVESLRIVLSTVIFDEGTLLLLLHLHEHPQFAFRSWDDDDDDRSIVVKGFFCNIMPCCCCGDEATTTAPWRVCWCGIPFKLCSRPRDDHTTDRPTIQFTNRQSEIEQLKIVSSWSQQQQQQNLKFDIRILSFNSNCVRRLMYSVVTCLASSSSSINNLRS